MLGTHSNLTVFVVPVFFVDFTPVGHNRVFKVKLFDVILYSAAFFTRMNGHIVLSHHIPSDL